MAELIFLFWNLRKEAHSRGAARSKKSSSLRAARVATAIADLTSSHDVDVLVLAEMEMDSSGIIAELQVTTKHTFSKAHADQCTKVKLFTRFGQQYLVSIPGASDDRCTFREVDLVTSPSILVVAGHFRPKGQGSSEFMRAGSRDGVPRKEAVSDHLPILFRLKL